MRHPVRVPTLTAVIAGVVVGVCAPLLTSTGGHAGQVAHVALSAGWSWAALAFCVGMPGGSKAASAARGAIALIAGVLAYYTTKAVRGDFLAADLGDPTGRTTYFSWGDFLSKALLWCFFACLLGPLLGAAGNLARNGPHRLPCRLLVPVVAVVENTMELGDRAPLQDPLNATTWAVIRVVAVAVILALVGHVAFDHRRRRPPEQVRAP